MTDGLRKAGIVAVLGVLLAASMGGPVMAQGPSAAARIPTLTARVDRALDELAVELAFDPDAIHAWVARNVAAETYPGLLKGARGTYVTRGGNDVDRASLIAALLERSLVPHRFASCPMTLAAAATPSPAARTTVTDDLAAAMAAAVTDPGLKAAFLAVPARLADAREQTDHLAGELADTLDGAGVVPIVVEHPIEPAVADHLWVQSAFGDGWRDLDPALAAGSAPCDAIATTADVPAGSEHRLRLTLEVEHRLGTVRSTQHMPLGDLAIADIATAHLAFAFGEAAGIGDAIVEAIGGVSQYTPILNVDGTILAGTPLLLPTPGVDGVVTELGGDLDGLLTQGELTGAWLQLELATPSGSVTTVRSEVLDRIGAGPRADGSADTVPLRGIRVLGADYVPLAALWQIGLFTGAFAAPEVLDAGPIDPFAIDTFLDRLDQLLRTWPALYHQLGGTATGPMVVLAGLSTDTRPDGTVADRLVLDALSIPAPPPQDAMVAALDAQAVLGAEQAVVATLGMTTSGLEDVRSVFAAAEADGTPSIRLSPGDRVAIEGASPDALGRIADRLAAGYTLITPAAAPIAGGVATTGWWLVDPRTGVVRDEHESGRHQLAEEATLWGRTKAMACRFGGIGLRIGGVVAVGTALLVASGTAMVVDPTGVGGMANSVRAGRELEEQLRDAGKKSVELACADADVPGLRPLP